MKIRTFLTKTAAVSLLTITASESALSCGENRFRAGHGLHYQSLRAAVSGSILIYQASRKSTAERALTKAGHNVTVVDSMESLRGKLRNSAFDVIILPYEAAALVRADIDLENRDAVVIPVVKGKSQASEAEAQYTAAIRTIAGSREIIRVVNDIVASKA
jgi:hypothetical protein